MGEGRARPSGEGLGHDDPALWALFLPRRHGERGNTITELYYFSPHWWRRNLANNGYELLHEEPMGLFYSGNYLMWRLFPLSKRGRMARYLGSATQLYKVRPLP
jgi:hypothetical protein